MKHEMQQALLLLELKAQALCIVLVLSLSCFLLGK